MAQVYRILGGIHLSSIEPINANVDLKKEYKISSILSVLPGPIPEIYTSNYNFKQIEITDEESSNIIQYFPETFAFIEDALYDESGKLKANILIHCSQGVSRSVTVIAAYLMQKHKLSLKNALHAVKRKNENAQPNPSFMRQLELFQELNYNVDKEHELYKKFILNMHYILDPSNSALHKLDAATPGTSEQIEKQEGEDYELSCKRCRRVLAKDEDIEPHTQPGAESRHSQFIQTAANSRRIIKVEEASANCSHYLLALPLDWMKPELEQEHIEGKFKCPKCDSKVGGYNWKGLRCSCGKWLVPAVYLQSAKVDNLKLINKDIPKVEHLGI